MSSTKDIHSNDTDTGTQPSPLEVTVCPSIGDEHSNEGGKVKKAYRDIIGTGIPVVAPSADIATVAKTLDSTFPWATDAVRLAIGEIAQKQAYGDPRLTGVLKPFLLVGPPGSGKTRFASELAHTLGLPLDTISASASDTAGLQAVSRGWASAMPCGPVNAIMRYGCANPVLLVDEIEKAKANNNNGHIWSTLLSMLNGDGQFYDSCLMSNVDLRFVNFWATANSIQDLPEPLLDRFIVIEMPGPSQEHANSILDTIIADEAKSIAATKMPTLPEFERRKITKILRGNNGSIRQMQQAYRAWVREQALRELLPDFLAEQDHDAALLDFNAGSTRAN
jgi:ATP-dependent Lon protease